MWVNPLIPECFVSQLWRLNPGVLSYIPSTARLIFTWRQDLGRARLELTTFCLSLPGSGYCMRAPPHAACLGLLDAPPRLPTGIPCDPLFSHWQNCILCPHPYDLLVNARQAEEEESLTDDNL